MVSLQLFATLEVDVGDGRAALIEGRLPDQANYATLLYECKVYCTAAGSLGARTAGGTADAEPRLVAERLSRKWGQPVIIENRTGAAENIGAELVYRSIPDGYTLLSAPPPPLVINQSLYQKLAFDPAKFEPIIVMAQCQTR
jgi:hypothetical protein